MGPAVNNGNSTEEEEKLLSRENLSAIPKHRKCAAVICGFYLLLLIVGYGILRNYAPSFSVTESEAEVTDDPPEVEEENTKYQPEVEEENTKYEEDSDLEVDLLDYQQLNDTDSNDEENDEFVRTWVNENTSVSHEAGHENRSYILDLISAAQTGYFETEPHKNKWKVGFLGPYFQEGGRGRVLSGCPDHCPLFPQCQLVFTNEVTKLTLRK